MTLMEDAKRGIINPSIEAVAKAEGIDPETVRSCVAKGLIAIPVNNRRETLPIGIGKYMSTKINANVGTSRDCIDIDAEIEKAKNHIHGRDCDLRRHQQRNHHKEKQQIPSRKAEPCEAVCDQCAGSQLKQRNEQA